MFYVSKVSLPFFFLAILDLLYSLAVKSLQLEPKIVWITAVFGFVAHTIMSIQVSCPMTKRKSTLIANVLKLYCFVQYACKKSRNFGHLENFYDINHAC